MSLYQASILGETWLFSALEQTCTYLKQRDKALGGQEYDKI